jgi:tetratricopeptide (TPR) repeat protein
VRAIALLAFLFAIGVFVPAPRAETQTKAEDCSAAVSGLTIGARVEIHCLSKEDIARVIDEFRRQGLLQRAEDVGIGTQVIADLAARLRPGQKLDLTQAVVEVSHAVDIAIKVVAEGASGSSDQLVDEVLKRIAERTKANDAQGATREAEEGFARWEKQEAERRAKATETGVALLEAALKTDLLRFDADSAAGRVEKIASLQHEGDPKAEFDALRERWSKFREEGLNKGVNFSLEVAIAIANREVSRARGPDQHGTALNDLGIVLQERGERESGTQRLAEAVAAYRAALTERTRERVPLQWAATQNNLGLALATLGERERGTQRLEEAVAAYRAALTERTRERVPLQWAMTQMNLSLVYRALFEKTQKPRYLDDALEAAGGGLEEFRKANAVFYIEKAERQRANILALKGKP